MNIIHEYIKYKFKSQKRHGIHSPFVYDFSDKCLSLEVPTEVLADFKGLKTQLLKDKTKIKVDDLGAGSKKLDKYRAVNQIANVSGSNDKYGRLLFRLVAYYPIKNVLELGTSLGLGTLMLASGRNDVKVITVEGCVNTMEVAKKYFPKRYRERVDFKHSSFVDYLESIPEEQQFDLIFIDGDHRSQSLFKQLELLKPFIHDDTIIVLDDIRWSDEMYNGWQLLVEDSFWHLSMDLFKMGIIIKRTSQQKESFLIAY